MGDAPPLAIETDDQEPARTETRGDDDQAFNRLARFVAKAAAGHSLERHNWFKKHRERFKTNLEPIMKVKALDNRSLEALETGSAV